MWGQILRKVCRGEVRTDTRKVDTFHATINTSFKDYLPRTGETMKFWPPQKTLISLGSLSAKMRALRLLLLKVLKTLRGKYVEIHIAKRNTL